jgi:3',5'-cyclic AMP phosphodiesterase CpdA
VRTIAHISDLHFGRHHAHIMEDLLVSLDEHRPDLVAFSGDFTQRARRGEFEQAREFLDRISFPKLVVPGNHDVPLYNVFRRFFRPWKRFNRYIASIGSPADFFGDDELAVLGLNSARSLTWKNGRISLAQLEAIRRAFADTPSGAFRIVMTHHPLGTPEGAVPLELAGRAQLVLQTLADAGVQLLLSGHHHRSEGGMIRLGERSMLVVHAGTAISSRTRGAEGNNYNLIRISPEEVSLQLMSWAENEGFRRDKGTRVNRWNRLGGAA